MEIPKQRSNQKPQIMEIPKQRSNEKPQIMEIPMICGFWLLLCFGISILSIYFSNEYISH
jgi:hypothetical protein